MQKVLVAFSLPLMLKVRVLDIPKRGRVLDITKLLRNAERLEK